MTGVVCCARCYLDLALSWVAHDRSEGKVGRLAGLVLYRCVRQCGACRTRVHVPCPDPGGGVLGQTRSCSGHSRLSPVAYIPRQSAREYVSVKCCLAAVVGCCGVLLLINRVLPTAEFEMLSWLFASANWPAISNEKTLQN